MMENVFEAAVAYTNAELNNYVRREDFYGLAHGTNATVNTIETRLGRIESEFVDFSSSMTGVLGTSNICGSISEVEKLRKEVEQIKNVLLDIQMMLRTLELDDMSKRMGDLDMLLT
jgi:archaellum component FlaC